MKNTPPSNSNNLNNFSQNTFFQNSMDTTKMSVQNLLSNHKISADEWAEQMIATKKKQDNLSAKIAIIENDLKKTLNDAKNRPTSAEIILEDSKNIHNFMARHNLACAIGCCGETTSADRVQEIADILNKNIPENSSVHISLYHDPDWKNIKKADPEEALEYFQVFIREGKQNPEELQKLMDEFSEIYHSIQR